MPKRGPGTYGLCPDCGRTVAGRADGIQRRTADKRWVLLGAHTRKPDGRGGQCLTRGARRRVPRILVGMRMPFEKLMEYAQNLSPEDEAKSMGELAKAVGEDSARLGDAVTAVRVLRGERTYI